MTGFRGFVSVAWRSGRGLFVLTVAMIALSAAAPIGSVVAIGQVVAGVADADSSRATTWAVVGAGCLLLQWIAGPLQRASATALGDSTGWPRRRARDVPTGASPC
ncbi:hypothetical protein ACWEOO_39865 [Kribbella sp. NPDC004138]